MQVTPDSGGLELSPPATLASAARLLLVAVPKNLATSKNFPKNYRSLCPIF